MGPGATNPQGGTAREALLAGLYASVLSTAVLAWRGRTDTGSAAAPLNAVSHWVWGDPALRRDDVTVGHTLVGTVIHCASVLLWSGAYAAWRRQRGRRGPADAVAGATAVALASAAVDLRVVPHRLSPGFQHRLSPASLTLSYASVGVGLALAALPSRRADPGPGAGPREAVPAGAGASVTQPFDPAI